MSESVAPEAATGDGALLRRELASAQAELAEARRAAEAAARAATAARELNVALLAKLDDPLRSPSNEELRRRSDELDKIYASRLWRWSSAPRAVYRSVRRVGRRS